jgi:glycosyltransferase involved in cell wall biosynthesis
MVHGLPVIASIGDGCEKDFIINGNTGYIIENMNSDDIVKHLEEFYLQPALLQQMKDAAYEIVTTRHDINSYIGRIKAAVLSVKN